MASGASCSHSRLALQWVPPAVSQGEIGTRDDVPTGPSDTNPPAVSQGAGFSNKVLVSNMNIGGTNLFTNQQDEFEDKLRQDLLDYRVT